MARAQDDSSSLRFGRRESERVIVALLVSLLVHLVIISGYYTGNKLGWWQKWHLPAWLQPVTRKFPLQAQVTHESEPNIFVDVSHADADAPVKPKYYSNKNARAANPDTAYANVPKINGRQTDVAKTDDVAKPAPKSSNPPTPETKPKETPKEAPKPEATPQLSKLQPSMPPPSPKPLPQSETPEPPQTPGETDLPKPKTDAPAPQPTPAVQPAPASAQSEPARPRTLKQALAQQQQIPGQQMHEAGGVARHALWSSLDAKATPFGDYDAAIIEAVSQRWYDLLDNHRYAQDRSGKVMLRFKLKPDGSIIEMQTLENTVGADAGLSLPGGHRGSRPVRQMAAGHGAHDRRELSGYHVHLLLLLIIIYGNCHCLFIVGSDLGCRTRGRPVARVDAALEQSRAAAHRRGARGVPDGRRRAQAARCLRASSLPLGRLLLFAANHLDWPKAENASSLETAARREIVRLERGLVVLEIIIGIAPLLGLVGTIVGMMTVFNDIGEAGLNNASRLAQGISVILKTTLIGLLIAIPALVAWGYFSKKVEVFAVEMETLCDEFIRRQYREKK